jgi:hypothetical protein
MSSDHLPAARDLSRVVELLEVPPSHYQKAIDRYESIAAWLSRPESSLLRYDPRVRCQGSFRIGTATKPLTTDGEYDLDIVVELQLLTHQAISQKALKRLLGDELALYAKSKNIAAPIEERKRVWRLHYADEVSFHIDVLPAIPEHAAFKSALVKAGVPADLADVALAITCKEHTSYAVLSNDWPHSNPAGFAKWFESRMRAVAAGTIKRLVESRAYASVEAVPAYEWKTPLQRAVQILKRHRDHMFAETPDLQPISVILTTLSGLAYEGQTDVLDTLTAILAKMPSLIRPTYPKVPNPVDPAEDFADKWRKNPVLEKSFWDWHAQASADIERFRRGLTTRQLGEHADTAFGVTLPESVRPATPAVAAVVSAPTVISSPSRPWGSARE